MHAQSCTTLQSPMFSEASFIYLELFFFENGFIRQFRVARSCYTTLADAELIVLLPWSLQCWDFRLVPVCLIPLAQCLGFVWFI